MGDFKYSSDKINKMIEEAGLQKVVLTMKDPLFCSNCPLAKPAGYNHNGKWICSIGHAGKSIEWVFEPIDEDARCRPDWCPLKPMPEHHLVWHDDERGDYDKGYNSCLDELLEYNEGWLALWGTS